MFKEILSAFRTSDPLAAMGRNFSEMLTLTCEMTLAAGELCFAGRDSPEQRADLYRRDVRVNQLERLIRQQVVAHLTLASGPSDVPYSLLLMSLVKDVERIGDYAKNLSEIVDLHQGPIAEDAITKELQQIRLSVERSFRALADVFETSNKERAQAFIRQRREAAQRCDALIARIAHSDYDAGTSTALALTTRYYKRIGGHVLNVLSSIVMPLHKVDYYDEDQLPGTEADAGHGDED